MAEAEAAILTAGARPNPTLSVAPGIPSLYLFILDLAVAIETAGKRPKTWDLGSLLLAALYFNPTSEAARARHAINPQSQRCKWIAIEGN